MNQPLTNSQMRDAEALLHPYTNARALRETGAMIIERGEGIRVFDTQGRGYIEAMAGLWCCGLGFGNRELVDTAAEQMAKLPYYHLFGGKSHEPAVELAEKIKALAPGRMARVFYQSSGSEANETQVKLAWYMNNALGRPEKKKIIARVKGYHGVTIVSASLTGLPYNHRTSTCRSTGSCTRRARITGRAPSRARASATSPAASPPISRRSSSARAPTRSPPSSRSPSWARVASSCRPKAISRRSARSAGNTTS
jgi:adenosylmethionine-8-amino-7-oxononanoate aminotransferase